MNSNRSCLCCKKIFKRFSAEHAFPKKLLQPNMEGWTLHKHYCKKCNGTILSELVQILKFQSPIGFIYNEIERELGRGSKSIETEYRYNKRPLRVFVCDIKNKNIIIRTVELYELYEDIKLPIIRELRPQIVLVVHNQDRTKDQIIEKTYSKFDSKLKGLVSYPNGEEDIYQIDENFFIIGNKGSKKFFRDFKELVQFVKPKLENKAGKLTVFPIPGSDLDDLISRIDKDFKLGNLDPGSLEIEIVPSEAQISPDLNEDIFSPKSSRFLVLGESDYYRSIAMIAFHNLLYHHSDRFTGHERIFDRIKQYIYHDNFGPDRPIVWELDIPSHARRITDPGKFFHKIDFLQSKKTIICLIWFYIGLKEPFLFCIEISGDSDKNKEYQLISSNHLDYTIDENSQLKNWILYPSTEEIQSGTIKENLLKWIV